jgi:hypothetical protein
LKPERWSSPLVQEKYQEEKACDKRHPYRIIIIIIIIIIIETAANMEQEKRVDRAGEGVGLKALDCWNRGFESRREHGCSYFVFSCVL